MNVETWTNSNSFKKDRIPRSRKLKEGQLKTSYFACGPAVVRIYHTNEYEDYYEEDYYYDRKTAKRIEDFINDGFTEDFAESYHDEGVESITFDSISSWNKEYYTVWKVVYDPSVADVEKIKDHLRAQMGNSWGPWVFGHAFDTEEIEEDVEYEEENEDGETYMETANTISKLEYYYDPWSFPESKYKVFIIDED